MTAGITDPETYYYRRVFTDAVRAVEAAASPLVDAARISSPAPARAAASPSRRPVWPDWPASWSVAPDVPFLCDFPRRCITDRDPYGEISNYLKGLPPRREPALRTLSYFDGVHFAARGRAPALFSAALEDQTCPPSTVFAAFNAWASEAKDIEVYDFNDHEGGQTYQQLAQLDWFANIFAAKESSTDR